MSGDTARNSIGPYRVIRSLGKGGMGTVYLAAAAEADTERDGQTVAVKVLQPQYAQDRRIIERFASEFEILNRFRHPNIVQILAAGVDGDTHFYVMEYVDGPDIAHMISQRGPLPWREVVDYGVQCCRGLKNAHDHGILHRDLKPANLLVDKQGQLKIADFGIARPWDAHGTTQTGAVIGTAAFMAPEQALGKRATSSGDLYCLGASLYSMLTAKPPFCAPNFPALLSKIVDAPVVPVRERRTDVPVELDALVSSLLSKAAADRPPSALKVERTLQSIILQRGSKTNFSAVVTEQARPSIGGDGDETAPLVSPDSTALVATKTDSSADHDIHAIDRVEQKKKVGPYPLKRPLGKGGMGAVYLSNHPETNVEVAVKVLDGSDSNLVERFQREVATLQQFHHPNIVRVFDFGRDGRRHYFAMEYVDGATLGKLIGKRGLPQTLAMDYGSQICAGLKAAHNQGVVHRDLKPENILVNRDGEAKIADFGIAKPWDASSLTMTGGLIGTLSYMSPEQAQGLPVTTASDLYSFGVVFYSMLTGQLPFRSDSMPGLVRLIIHERAAPPHELNGDVTPELSELVCHCLEKDPARRPPNALWIQRYLKAIRSGRPETRPTMPPSPPVEETSVATANRNTDDSATAGTEPNFELALAEYAIKSKNNDRRDFFHNLSLLLGLIFLLLSVPTGIALNRWAKRRRFRSEGGSASRSQDLKGLTWVKRQTIAVLGIVQVGCDNDSDPIHGDTANDQELPILAIKVDGSPRPNYDEHDTYHHRQSHFNRWANGRVALTPPISGKKLTSLQAAHDFCRKHLGKGYRMAEFHDGGGWSFYAYGDLPDEGRFWVHINDQRANCWD